MEFTVGDPIQLLDSRDKGQVLQVYPDGRILVRLEDGLEIEVLSRDISRTTPQTAAEKAERVPQGQTDIGPLASLDTGIYLVIDRPVPTKTDILLFNHTDLDIHFAVTSILRTGELRGVISGKLVSEGQQLLFSLAGSDWMEQFADRRFEWLYFSAKPFTPRQPVSVDFRLKQRQLLREPMQNVATGRNNLFVPLHMWGKDAQLENTLQEIASGSDSSKLSGPPPRVVDLHIEKLTPEYKSLDKAAILSHQLEHFEQMLSLAIAHKLPEITFIHGLGNGTLRSELHKILRHNRYVKAFYLDDEKQFGYGATRVKL